MNIKLFFLSFTIIVVIASCSTSGNLSSGKKKAKTDYKAGNYAEALKEWEAIIAEFTAKGKILDTSAFCFAGKAAFKLKQYEKAQKYFEKARELNYADAEMYASLAKCYKNIDNLSREMTALETYDKKFPEGKEIADVRQRLFELYVESENWNLAENIWGKLSEMAKSKTTTLQAAVILNEQKEKFEAADQFAAQLLEKDKNNLIALNYKANRSYEKTEKWYKKEMESYEKNKTRKQYAKLLKALKKITIGYKEAAGYFKTLYKLEPKAIYAKHLANIYARLNDKKTSEYYRKLSKK